MANLRVLKIAAKCGIYPSISIRRDIFNYCASHRSSLKACLEFMNTQCKEGMKYCEQSKMIPFDIHFVVLSTKGPTRTSSHIDSINSRTYIGAQVFRREVEILNEMFVDRNRHQICENGFCVEFRYKSHTFLDDITNSNHTLLEYGDQTDPVKLIDADEDYYKSQFKAAVWKCTDKRFCDPFAINIYIIDRKQSEVTSSGWITVEATHCQASYNRNFILDSEYPSDGDEYIRPYILFDYSRLLHSTRSPEEHEMGHIFGLNHNRDPNITPSDSSNIMQFSYGGLRNEGFGIIRFESSLVKQAEDNGVTYVETDFDQIPVVKEYARKIQAAWCRFARLSS